MSEPNENAQAAFEHTLRWLRDRNEEPAPALLRQWAHLVFHVKHADLLGHWVEVKQTETVTVVGWLIHVTDSGDFAVLHEDGFTTCGWPALEIRKGNRESLRDRRAQERGPEDPGQVPVEGASV